MFGPEVADLAICYLIGLARNDFYRWCARKICGSSTEYRCENFGIVD